MLRCEGDKIPTNEYGNVEVINGDTSRVPEGAVFVDMAMAFKAATQLKVPCAKAVIGFERRGGAGVTTPTFRGCVCLEKDADMVRDAATDLEKDRDERKEKKREDKVLKNWARLVGAALNFEHLMVMLLLLLYWFYCSPSFLSRE